MHIETRDGALDSILYSTFMTEVLRQREKERKQMMCFLTKDWMNWQMKGWMDEQMDARVKAAKEKQMNTDLRNGNGSGTSEWEPANQTHG